MKYEQQKRFDKLSTDEIYLLEHQQQNSSASSFYEFTIAGSTRNVYKVNLLDSGKTSCNCPDFLGHAKRAGCVCKHVCFVMSRVLKYKNVSFYDSHNFEVEIVKKLCSQLNVETIDSCLVNLSLSEKYVERKDNQIKFDKYREIKEGDECPICYTDLVVDSPELVIGCPTCLGAVHRKCMEKWLTNKKSCCYCRNRVWENYGEVEILQL
jgi:hypothetical protein